MYCLTSKASNVAAYSGTRIATYLMLVQSTCVQPQRLMRLPRGRRKGPQWTPRWRRLRAASGARATPSARSSTSTWSRRRVALLRHSCVLLTVRQ